MRVRFKGLAKAARKIETLARAAGDANVSGIRVIGESIATDVRASRPGAGIPRDEGVLAASIRVSGPDGKGVVRLTAGGAAAPYALRQHEELSYRHTVGEARYWVRGLERFLAGGGATKALRENAQAGIRAAKRA
jgi:hypothetical protein